MHGRSVHAYGGDMSCSNVACVPLEGLFGASFLNPQIGGKTWTVGFLFHQIVGRDAGILLNRIAIPLMGLKSPGIRWRLILSPMS